MEKHKAVVMGRIEKKRYRFILSNYNSRSEIKKSNEFVEYKEIWSGDLENPPLETGEGLYIKELNTEVGITNKAKSTEGGYVYWTTFVIEEIEDEKTQETKLASEQAKMAHIKYIEEKYCKTEEDLKMNEKSSKKWWQF
jgi:hypothetical protein